MDRLYDYDSIYEFLKIFAMVSSTLIDQEDFARAAYESIEDGVKLGNLRYREMFFNPTLHTKRGVPYKTVVDGLVDGIQAAESDFGVPCRLIADVYRQDSPAEAREMVEQVLEHRRDELIGLGMDGAEAPDPPEQFVDAYRLAGSGGLRLTAHACEDAPAQNIATCLDVLGCERIDHGYHILGDDALVERCRDEGITFTVCPTATAVCYFDPEDYTTHPIREMAARGPEDHGQLGRPVDVPHGHRDRVREDGERGRVGCRHGSRAEPERRRRVVALRRREAPDAPGVHGRARPARSGASPPRGPRPNDTLASIARADDRSKEGT